MLGQVNIFGKSKVDVAIDRIRAFEPPDGYYLAFSGGKDSQCVYHLAKMAGVSFDAHYSVTTVDPPELMKFIRDNYPDVIWDHPKYNGKPTSMWKLIPEHTVPPTRKVRYCCDILKEQHGQGRVVITGVRWAESATRKNTHGVVDMRTKSKKIINESLENNPAATLNTRGGLIFNDDNDETRKTVEQCYQKRRTTLNPIIDWDDDEVWEFIKEVVKVPYCSLYDEGFTRLGCIGCPLQGTKGMIRDFERWPRYKELYIKAFDEMIKRHQLIKDADGKPVEVGGQTDVRDLPLVDMNGSNKIDQKSLCGSGLKPQPQVGQSVVELERRREPDLLDEQQQQISRGGCYSTTGQLALTEPTWIGHDVINRWTEQPYGGIDFY